jgi:hypothetical protein
MADVQRCFKVIHYDEDQESPDSECRDLWYLSLVIYAAICVGVACGVSDDVGASIISLLLI